MNVSPMNKHPKESDQWAMVKLTTTQVIDHLDLARWRDQPTVFSQTIIFFEFCNIFRYFGLQNTYSV